MQVSNPEKYVLFRVSESAKSSSVTSAKTCLIYVLELFWLAYVLPMRNCNITSKFLATVEFPAKTKQYMAF